MASAAKLAALSLAPVLVLPLLAAVLHTLEANRVFRQKVLPLRKNLVEAATPSELPREQDSCLFPCVLC